MLGEFKRLVRGFQDTQKKEFDGGTSMRKGTGKLAKMQPGKDEGNNNNNNANQPYYPINVHNGVRMKWRDQFSKLEEQRETAINRKKEGQGTNLMGMGDALDLKLETLDFKRFNANAEGVSKRLLKNVH